MLPRRPAQAPASSAAGLHRRAARAITSLVEALVAGAERRRQRRDLALLDDRLLRDIGLTRGEAARVWRKPFWR